MEFLKKYSLLLTVFFSFALIFTSSFSGIRIPFYKIFQLLFIIFSLFSLSNQIAIKNSPNFFLNNNIFALLVILFTLKVFSGLLVMFNNYSVLSYYQYFKWIIFESVDLLFYFYFIKYFLGSNLLFKKSVINVFAFSIIFSSFFSIVQFIVYYFYQYNIISMIIDLPLIWSQDNLLNRYAWGPVLRVGGFMVGPNLYATVLCSFIPLVLYTRFFRYRNYILFLLFLSLILTLSRTGFLTLFVILLLGLIYRKLSFKFLLYPSLFLGMVFTFIYKNFSDIFNTFTLRFNVEGVVGSRFDVFLNSFQIFLENPFGVGINNFSEVYFLQYGLRGFNPHNDWLTLLVELGVLGLISYIFYYLYLIVFSKRNIHDLSFPLFCIIVSQCIAGFFNQTLVLFQSNFIIIILYLFITSESNEKFD